MRSRYHHLPDRSHVHFMEPWAGYPNRPPDDPPGSGRHWSDDLVISQSNRAQLSWLGKRHLPVGGGFWTVKRAYSESSSLGEGPHLFSTTSDPTAISWVHGSWYSEPAAHTAHVDNASFPVVGYSNPTWVLEPMSTQAIAEMLPNLPEFDGATALGELVSEGLPALMGAQSLRDRTLNAQTLGSEYLNSEFGWKPLVRDVRAFAHTLQNQAKVMQDLLRRSNRVLRRKYAFPVESSQEVETSNFAFPVPSMSLYYHGIGRKQKITTRYRKVWVSAAFYYHYPEAEAYAKTLGGMMERARHLYGIRLTPDVLWNLAPWSWAADWFSTVGDVMTNISAFSDERLSMPYAYLMEEKSERVEYVLRIKFRSYGNKPQTLRQSFETTSKFRMNASPFAFGLLSGTLSNRQKAIAGALAASRGGGRSGRSG